MISKDDIKKLGELSRIEIPEHALEKLAEDLEAILGYVDTLKEVDVADIKEISYLPYLLNTIRPDEILVKGKGESMNDAAELLEAAPKTEDGYVVVKSVLGKEV